jgi:hypothetical protein
MPYTYDPPPSGGSLRQGELLGPIWEHRSLAPPVEVQAGEEARIRAVRHELTVVMTADCDLLWDFNARFPTEEAKDALTLVNSDHEDSAIAVPHVLVCEAYAEVDARTRVRESRLFKLIQQNRDERYHHFSEAPITGTEEVLPDVYIDFKKSLAVPTAQLYEGIRVGGVLRKATVPPVYRHDLMQRFYAYLSRVAVPAP